MEKVTRGQKQKSNPLRTVAGINAAVDAINDYQARALGGGGEGGTAQRLPDGLIRVKNSSGADRAFGEVLQLKNYLITEPAFDKRRLWIDGDEPDDMFAEMAFCWEPIPDGEIGWAQIGRLVAVRHSASDGTPAEKETWGVKPGEYALRKNWPGFRCLVAADEDNQIMLAVREEQPFYLCKADAAISKGSTGTASLYVGASGSETDSTINITNCRAKWGAIATGKWCGVSFVNGVPYITQLEC